MDITVVICTYNRSQSLATALDSILRSELPASTGWEILVVDNNSADNTREVVARFAEQHPDRLRYFFEPKPGKSNALNSALRIAQGEILAFTDDDVTVEPTWLRNLTKPVLSGECVGSGGRILPERGFSPPNWFPRENRHELAPIVMFDHGLTAGELTETPYGANMAFHKGVFERCGYFRTDLGPNPGNNIRSEDTEFGRRVLEAGEPLHYEPSAVVYHAMPPHRITKRYFLSWFYAKGRGDIRESSSLNGTKYFIRGVPLYLIRRLAVWIFRWMITLDPSRRFSARLKVWWLAGEIVESFQQPNEVVLRTSDRH